jgi:hypothetical protein
MAMHFFHPEMGEQRHPESQIEASLGHYGNHYYIKTPLELKGRGIRKERTLTAEMLVPQAWRKIGWHEYTVTLKAMEKLAEQYVVTGEMLL